MFIKHASTGWAAAVKKETASGKKASPGTKASGSDSESNGRGRSAVRNAIASEAAAQETRRHDGVLSSVQS